MPIVFKVSLPSESASLRKIAINSKSHWGYSRELLESLRSAFPITENYIRKNIVRTLWDESSPVGFFSIVKGPPALLDHLWLLPSHIGKGFGRLAFEEIYALCRAEAISELNLLSDPNAASFYLHHGALRIGEVYSELQDAMLPKLTLRIQQSPTPRRP